MEFKHLQSYTAVIDHRSFSKAAQSLYISQPSITTHVQLLEEELGVSLLNRSARGIEMTPAGKDFYDYACSILKLRDRMLTACSREERKVIRIGTSTVPSAYILPELLSAYRDAHRDVTFEITQSDSKAVLTGIVDGLYDIGFVGSMFKNTELTFTPVRDDALVLAAPAQEPWLSLPRSAEALPRLLASPLILREDGSGSGTFLTRLLEYVGLVEADMDIAARSNDPEAIKRMVENGMGVTCISRNVVGDAAAAGRLLIFPLPDELGKRRLYLVRKTGFPEKPHAAELVQFIEQR